MRAVILWLAAVLCSTTSVQAQTYPTKQIRIVIGTGPTSAPDVLARILQPKLQELWPTGVYIENKPGGIGLLATQDVVRASPDGYSVLFGGLAAIAIAPHLSRKYPYDLRKDLVAVAQLAGNDAFLTVSTEKNPAKTFAEFVEWGKLQPKVFIGDLGAGSYAHFITQIFGRQANVQVDAIHYKGTADALHDLLSGQIHAGFLSFGIVSAQVQSGRLRILGSTAPSRQPVMPEVPTFAELGMPDLVGGVWWGVFVPAGTPQNVLDTLHAGFNQVIQMPELRDKLQAAGFRVSPGISRAEFAAFVVSETDKWGKVVSQSGFKENE